MKENESAEQVVENREEKCEKAAEQKNIKKINGDTRTFVIALLTSLIVVLLYHGVLTGIRCLKGNCPPPQATAGECRMPQKAKNKSSGQTSVIPKSFAKRCASLTTLIAFSVKRSNIDTPFLYYSSTSSAKDSIYSQTLSNSSSSSIFWK